MDESEEKVEGDTGHLTIKRGDLYGGGLVGYHSGETFPKPTTEQIAKTDRCQALSYAMQVCGHMGDGDHIVNTAKTFEAYLKG